MAAFFEQHRSSTLYYKRVFNNSNNNNNNISNNESSVHFTLLLPMPCRNMDRGGIGFLATEVHGQMVYAKA
jgi:hypothetical protein